MQGKITLLKAFAWCIIFYVSGRSNTLSVYTEKNSGALARAWKQFVVRNIRVLCKMVF